MLRPVLRDKPETLHGPYKRPKLYAPCPDAYCWSVLLLLLLLLLQLLLYYLQLLPDSQHRAAIAGAKSRPWRKSGLSR